MTLIESSNVMVNLSVKHSDWFYCNITSNRRLFDENKKEFIKQMFSHDDSQPFRAMTDRI